MKKSIFCLLAVIAAMTACNREGIENPESNAMTVKVNAGLAGGPKTKTAIVPGEGNQFSFTWIADDKLAVIEAVPHIAYLIESDPDNNYPYPAEVYYSDPLTANATEAVFSLDLPERDYLSGDLHYVAIYPADCAIEVPGGGWVYEENKIYTTIDFPRYQKPLPDSFDPAADVLVSKEVVCTSRPSELTFQFARVGTIVKMVLTGIPEGTVITGGSVQLGFEAGYYFEYDPTEERIRFSDGTDGIDFSYEDGLVVGADRTATVWLRSMSGVSDFIDLYLYTPDEDYHRSISLRARGTTLEFKEGGLTTFSVRLGTPDVDNPDQEDIDYYTNEVMDGVTFTWPYSENPLLAGYECFLFDENGIRHEFDSACQDGSNFVATVNGGLPPGEYVLYVRALAVAGSESQHDYLEVMDILIGVPKTLTINKVIAQYSVPEYGLEIPGHEDVDTEDSYYGVTFYHRNLDWSYQCIQGVGGRTKSWALWNKSSVRLGSITVKTKSGSNSKYQLYSSDSIFTDGVPGSSSALVGTSNGEGGHTYDTGYQNYFLLTGTETLDISNIVVEYYK